MPSRRPCRECGKNRAEKFFRSKRGRVCTDCQRKTRRRNARQRHLRDEYGIDADDYERMFAFQDGACAVCRGERSYNLQVDHDHKTGLVRGLLCKACNKRLLPAARDNERTLLNAVEYLRFPPARRVLGDKRVPDSRP